MARGEEDTRGVEAFIDWVMGDANREIQRISGMGKAGNEDGLGTVQTDPSAGAKDFLAGTVHPRPWIVVSCGQAFGH